MDLILVVAPLGKLPAQLRVARAGLVEIAAQRLLEVPARARDDSLLTERDAQQHADPERQEHRDERDRVIARREQEPGSLSCPRA